MISEESVREGNVRLTTRSDKTQLSGKSIRCEIWLTSLSTPIYALAKTSL